MNNVWSEDLKLVSYHVDHKAFWRTSSIFTIMQEVANDHTSSLGCGWKDLTSKYNICWVLTRMRVEMKEFPKVGDTIKVKTWPDAKARMVFTRYFTFEKADGTPLGAANSQWVLLDVNSRSLVRPAEHNIPMLDTSSIIPPDIKIGKMVIPQSFDLSTVRSPVYSDLDYNSHVNNARYVEWIADMFDASVFDNKRLNIIDIKFICEIRSGSEVILELTKATSSENERISFFVVGKNINGQHYFEATGELY